MATGTVLAVAALVVAAAGTAQAAVSARKQAKAQSAILQQQATREQLEAAAREETFRRDQARLLARRRAILGAAGVEPGEGSPLLTSEDFASETELQALRIRSGGELQQTRLQQQALLEESRGGRAQAAGFVRSGSLLVAGAGRAFGSSSPTTTANAPAPG